MGEHKDFDRKAGPNIARSIPTMCNLFPFCTVSVFCICFTVWGILSNYFQKLLIALGLDAFQIIIALMFSFMFQLLIFRKTYTEAYNWIASFLFFFLGYKQIYWATKETPG